MSSADQKATVGQLLVSFTIGHLHALPYDCVTAELPVLVQRLPEYWDLPAFLGMEYAIQCTLVSAIVLILMKMTTAIDALSRHRPVLLVTMGFLKVIFLVLMMAFWDSISTVNGKKYSIAFQVFYVLILAVSTVTFVFGLSYVGTFPQECVAAFFFGMGSGGTVYASIAFLQDAGEFDCVNNMDTPAQYLNLNSSEQLQNLRHWNGSSTEVVYRPGLFSVVTYFGIVAAICLCCCVSLLVHVMFLRLRLKQGPENVQLINRNDGNSNHSEEDTEPFKDRGNIKELEHHTCETDSLKSAKQPTEILNKKVNTPNPSAVVVIVCVYIGLLQGLYHGISSPLMTYATLPYGSLTFNLCRRICSVLEPVGSLVYAFFPVNSIRALSVLLGLCMTHSVYVCVVAVMSPSPPLVSTDPNIGSALMVSSYILMVLNVAYTRTALSTVAAGLGQEVLTYYGLVREFCIIVFMIPTFICIDVLKLLTDIPQCS